MDNIKQLEDQIFKKIKIIIDFFENNSKQTSKPNNEDNFFEEKVKNLESQKNILENEISKIKNEHSDDLKELNQIIDEIKLLLENSDARS